MTCFSYMYILRYLRKVPYGRERTRGDNLRKLDSRRTPFINKTKSLQVDIAANAYAGQEKYPIVSDDLGFRVTSQMHIRGRANAWERWRGFHICLLRHLRKVYPRLYSTMYPSSRPPPFKSQPHHDLSHPRLYRSPKTSSYRF